MNIDSAKIKYYTKRRRLNPSKILSHIQSEMTPSTTLGSDILPS